jgi:hypothetical protein
VKEELMTVLEEVQRAREQHLDFARIKYLESGFEAGKWSEFWTFDELCKMVVSSQGSDLEKIRIDERVPELRKKCYRHLAKSLTDATKMAERFLPDCKMGESVGWLTGVRTRLAKRIIRRSYLKVFQEMIEAEKHNTVESLNLRNSFYLAHNIFASKGCSEALEEIERELPKFRN